jgi:hypothetical protein
MDLKEEDQAIQQFRDLISKIKTPLLNDVADEAHIATQLGTLFNILTHYIRTGMYDENIPLSKDLVARFKLDGGFRYLDSNRKEENAKQLFLHYLELDVQTYPYTIAPKATNFHAAHHVRPNK